MPNYPSNITCQQFKTIRLELENFHQRTNPRQVDLYFLRGSVRFENRRSMAGFTA